MSTPMLAAAKRGFREIQGVVVSAGLMDRTVKVRVGGRVWNDQIKKVRKESIHPRPYQPTNPRLLLTLTLPPPNDSTSNAPKPTSSTTPTTR